jgi:hypothetical protein
MVDLHVAPSEMWPHDTAYSLPFVLAGIYALMCAPFVAGAVAMWARVPVVGGARSCREVATRLQES